MTRINYNMSAIQMLVAMADGNPGAVSVMTQMLQKGNEIDPEAMLGGGLMAILDLDTMGVYGSDIWVLYKDICGESVPMTIGLLRAVQMGIIGESVLKQAIQDERQQTLSLPEPYRTAEIFLL